MHRGIIDHEDYLRAGNEQLRGMDFAFLSFDKGTSKKLIIARLRQFGVTFVDVGMGIYLTDDTLGGVLRTATVTAAKHDHVQARIPFSDGDGNNEYGKTFRLRISTR